MLTNSTYIHTAIIVESSGNNEEAYTSDNDFVDIELAEETKEPSPGTYIHANIFILLTYMYLYVYVFMQIFICAVI